MYPSGPWRGYWEQREWGRQPMRDLVRDANAVRWYNPALRSDNVPDFPHFDAQNGVLAFHDLLRQAVPGIDEP